tara:strand:+ start:150 stop:353 length:204 start_codon:yes stop_codon:yes gene_type:complete
METKPFDEDKVQQYIAGAQLDPNDAAAFLKRQEQNLKNAIPANEQGESVVLLSIQEAARRLLEQERK